IFHLRVVTITLPKRTQRGFVPPLTASSATGMISGWDMAPASAVRDTLHSGKLQTFRELQRMPLRFVGTQTTGVCIARESRKVSRLIVFSNRVPTAEPPSGGLVVALEGL